jgi:hypothetical protein
MTDRVEEIQQRVEKATPGPWFAKHRAVDCCEHDDECCGLGLEIEGPPEATNRGQFYRGADAAFIAHAREDIPWLLAEVERLSREREPQDLTELRARFAEERREKLARGNPDAAQALGLAAKLEEEAAHHRAAHPTGGMSDVMRQGASCIRRFTERVYAETLTTKDEVMLSVETLSPATQGLRSGDAVQSPVAASAGAVKPEGRDSVINALEADLAAARERLTHERDDLQRLLTDSEADLTGVIRQYQEQKSKVTALTEALREAMEMTRQLNTPMSRHGRFICAQCNAGDGTATHIRHYAHCSYSALANRVAALLREGESKT